jgi:hypothetical protein
MLGQCCSFKKSRNIAAHFWEVAGIQNNIKNISHRHPMKNYAKINVMNKNSKFSSA